MGKPTKNHVFLNENNIIEILVVGDQTVDTIQAMGDEIMSFAEQLRKSSNKVLVLDNLCDLGSVPPEGRQRVVDLGKEIDYDKLAMYGKGALVRFGSNLMFRAMGKSDEVKYFDDYDSAIKWLNT